MWGRVLAQARSGLATLKHICCLRRSDQRAHLCRDVLTGLQTCGAAQEGNTAATCIGPFAAIFDDSCRTALSTVLGADVAAFASFGATATDLNDACQNATSAVRLLRAACGSQLPMLLPRPSSSASSLAIGLQCAKAVV